MRYAHRGAIESDLQRIVEIYNFAVASRKCSCDLDPTTIEARRRSFEAHTPNHRPL
jgi:L-amino acid N-acyltransferase YncA